MAPPPDPREPEATIDRSSHRGPCALCPGFSTFTASSSCYLLALPCCKQPHPAPRYSFFSSESQHPGPLPRSDSLAVPPWCAACCPRSPFSHPNWGGVPAVWAGLPCWDESPLNYELFLPEVCFAWLGWLGLDCWDPVGDAAKARKSFCRVWKPGSCGGYLDRAQPCSVQA